MFLNAHVNNSRSAEGEISTTANSCAHAVGAQSLPQMNPMRFAQEVNLVSKTGKSFYAKAVKC